MSVVLGYKFAAIPEWVLYHPDLTGDDVRLFGVLARYGNDVHPSRATVAKAIGKSTDTVDRCLARLVATGAVIVEKRFQGDTQLPNRYYLAGDSPIAEGSRTDAEGGGGVDAEPPAAEMRHEREQDNESKNNEKTTPPTPRKRGALDEQFDNEFAPHWKKRTGIGNARKIWRDSKKMTAADRVDAIAMIERHAAWWVEHETEPKFVPQMDTWLNQRRWEEDEPRSATVLTAVPTNDWIARSKARLAAFDQTQTGAT